MASGLIVGFGKVVVVVVVTVDTAEGWLTTTGDDIDEQLVLSSSIQHFNLDKQVISDILYSYIPSR